MKDYRAIVYKAADEQLEDEEYLLDNFFLHYYPDSVQIDPDNPYSELIFTEICKIKDEETEELINNLPSLKRRRG